MVLTERAFFANQGGALSKVLRSSRILPSYSCCQRRVLGFTERGHAWTRYFFD